MESILVCKWCGKQATLKSRIIDVEWGGPRVYKVSCPTPSCYGKVITKIRATADAAITDWNTKNGYGACNDGIS